MRRQSIQIPCRAWLCKVSLRKLARDTGGNRARADCPASPSLARIEIENTKSHKLEAVTTASINPTIYYFKRMNTMSSKQAIIESAAKKPKKRNVVLVTEDYNALTDRFHPMHDDPFGIEKPFEVDQDDLQVVDEIIRKQREIYVRTDLNHLAPNEMGLMWRSMTRRGVIVGIGDGKYKRVTKLGRGIPLLLETLPPCIAQLDALESLNIEGACSITSIPEWIGDLKNLKFLTLPFSGNVTDLPNSLFNLDKLEHFSFEPTYDDDLDDDESEPHGLPYIAIPDLIGKLTKLNTLRLSNVNFLPQELENLTSLETLKLYNYQVKFFPTSIGKLSNLKTLHIIDAKVLRSLPQSIGQLKNLKELHLQKTSEFKSLPESIGNIRSLELLRVNYNSSLNSIPSTIGNISGLRYLYLSHNLKLTRLPDCFGSLLSLKTLDVSFTKISSLPPSVFELKNLEFLELTATRLKSLPQKIASLTNLRFLGLSNTDIKSLPDLKKLKKLRYLTLDCTPFHENWTSIEEIMKRYQLVTCFGDFIPQHMPENAAFFYELFSRKAKEKVLTLWGKDSSLPLSFWSLILAKHPRCFCDEALSDGNRHIVCGCCTALFDHDFPPGPTQSDVRFQVLKEFGHKFISSGVRASNSTIES